MPINIEGWVEFSPYTNKKEREEEFSWLTWMDIGALINLNDEINCIIFGDPRDLNNDQPIYSPIAKNRGFPNNPGQSLKSDINRIFEYEKKYGKGELFGFTNFYFSEIESVDWKEKYNLSINESDWGKLFDLTNKFKNLKQIDSEQIRFTVWYNW